MRENIINPVRFLEKRREQGGFREGPFNNCSTTRQGLLATCEEMIGWATAAIPRELDSCTNTVRRRGIDCRERERRGSEEGGTNAWVGSQGKPIRTEAQAQSRSNIEY